MKFKRGPHPFLDRRDRHVSPLGRDTERGQPEARSGNARNRTSILCARSHRLGPVLGPSSRWRAPRKIKRLPLPFGREIGRPKAAEVGGGVVVRTLPLPQEGITAIFSTG